MEEQHVFDLIPGYALGILDQDEKTQVENHLRACELCSEELLSLTQVVDELPAAMRISQPSPDLKNRLMNRAKQDRPSALAAQPASFWEQLQQFMRDRAPLLAAASLALILILLTTTLTLYQRVTELENAMHAELITLEMVGTDFTPQAAGMLVMSAEGNYGVLIVDGLPALDSDRQYQLWLIQDGKRTSGGVFSVNEQGYGNLRVDSPQPLIQYAAFGVTIEPYGGSPGPTGDKVLGGQF